MKTKEMDILMAHIETYFHQTDGTVLHPIAMEPHVDVLLYKPSEQYPFWKLVTMGASDYKMPGKDSLGNRNEYIMFVNSKENLEDKETRDWYYSHLLEVALYSQSNHTFIGFGHSVEMKPEAEEEMVGAFIDFPQVIDEPGILRCKLGLFKTAICLQVVLLNREEINKLLEIGSHKFSEYLYPENDGDFHFLSERKRSAYF